MFMRMTRRSLVTSLARILPLALWSGSLAQVLRAAEVESGIPPARGLLPSILHELFPHPGLGDDFYAEKAGVMWQQFLADPELGRDVGSGLARLATCCSGGWRQAGRDARVAALTRMQDEKFFQALRDSAVTLIYRDPRVWQRIGYGGNALAQGGYLTRGFDHIDWLPAVNP